MRRHYFDFILGAAVLALIAALVYGPPALQRRREAITAEKEREWTQRAAQELGETPPPPAELGLGTNNLAWITQGYLVFSNGWAAFKMHSLHSEDGMRDMALLRGADGALYYSHFHFCCGMTDDFKDPMQSPNIPRPKDLKEFLEKYATSWRPYSGS